MPREVLSTMATSTFHMECGQKRAVISDTLGLCEASRHYNIPVETIRKRVNGSVKMGCRPGPSTILTEEEEDKLVSYLITMADMGYGIRRETVMEMAFTIAARATHSRKGRQAVHDLKGSYVVILS